MNTTIEIPIIRIIDDSGEQKQDILAIEEPLEIKLEYGLEINRKSQNLAVTMRTPGHDADLAVGFLFTEGIIIDSSSVKNVFHVSQECSENKENTIVVTLNEETKPHLSKAERNFYTTSSCGVCGKASISAIRTVSSFKSETWGILQIDPSVFFSLPHMISRQQEVFADTGGLHGAALFSPEGELLLIREDVGRHNAVDKVIGASFMQGLLPLNRTILMLSGRASFELVQKAAMAGIPIIASVGAPSSLAVSLAKEFGITLVGFLRDNRFNIYSAASRIKIPSHENSH